MKLEQRITTCNKNRPIVKKSLNVLSYKFIIQQKYAVLIQKNSLNSNLTQQFLNFI